jgi:hypothetical protein
MMIQTKVIILIVKTLRPRAEGVLTGGFVNHFLNKMIPFTKNSNKNTQKTKQKAHIKFMRKK